MAHRERHRSERIGWLRAAVLGANDGIVSTASLIVGVAAAAADAQHVLVAGVAGLVAGALSMAAGEYVSVSSQADTERADIKREKGELATQPQAEEDELTGIYARRGLEPELARTVARQLMAKGVRRACARRAGIDRGACGEAAAGGAGIGRHFRGWRRSADPHHPARARQPAVARCLDRVADLPGCARRDRGTNRWSPHAGRCREGHHLGECWQCWLLGGRWKGVRYGGRRAEPCAAGAVSALVGFVTQRYPTSLQRPC